MGEYADNMLDVLDLPDMLDLLDMLTFAVLIITVLLIYSTRPNLARGAGLETQCPVCWKI